MTTTDVKTLLGRNVKYYRKQKHMSQEHLAEILNISQKHLSTIESGVAFVSAEVLQGISVALDIPLYLLFYDGPQEENTSEEFAKIDLIIDDQMKKATEYIKKRISGLI